MTALAFETARPRPLSGIPIPCGWRILIAMEPVVRSPMNPQLLMEMEPAEAVKMEPETVRLNR